MKYTFQEEQVKIPKDRRITNFNNENTRTESNDCLKLYRLFVNKYIYRYLG